MAAPRGTETARSSLRVLVASDQWFPDVRGGVARLATESAERLTALGHDVTALASRSASPAPRTCSWTGSRLSPTRASASICPGRCPSS